MSVGNAGWEALSFEERQVRWPGFQRTFKQHHGRGERPTVWTISVTGDTVHTMHGLEGGAMQQTSYKGRVKNPGRSNEVSAEVDALAEARRDCRKKWDFEGYDEYIGAVNIDHRNENTSVAHILSNLPGSFCLYKPENNLRDQKKLLAKAEAGNVLYTLKRDGVAKWVVIDHAGNIQIYSRRSRAWADKEGPKERADGTLDYSEVVLWTARFPHLVQAIRDLDLPNGTMMACELVLPTEDDFPYVSGLTKGYTARAWEDQTKNGRYASLYWWDIPFYGGNDLVSTMPVSYRYALIAQHSVYVSPHLVQPIQVCKFRNTDEALKEAKKLKIEGWVVVDPDAVYGDKGWNLKGKPDRPSSCAKLKPVIEGDFIAYWDPDKKHMGEWGSGKHEKGKKVKLPSGEQVVHGGVGSVALYQYDSKGNLVYISDCSSGMDYEFQAKLHKSHFPFVVEVEFHGRTFVSEGDKTNALRFPVFKRLRPDKAPEECIEKRLDVE